MRHNACIIHSIITAINVLILTIFIIVIIITRLKPVYGWDRGAKIQFQRVNFGVFSTSRFAPLALSSDWLFLRGSKLTLLRKW